MVAFSALVMMASATTMYSFGVFFKPLAASFGWNRATTSGVQSLYLLSMGIFSIIVGRLADRFGRARILAIFGSLAAAGLMLSSQTHALWQLYITYSIMAGIGLSCTFSVTGTTTASWFVERRGLALGIVSSGVGLGNFIGVPGVERLIAGFGWPTAYLVLGAAVGAIMLSGAYILRRRPEPPAPRPHTASTAAAARGHQLPHQAGGEISFWGAMRTGPLWIMVVIFSLFPVSNQIVMVHLVNYATDHGITPLVAATLVSAVGLSGFAGRILMGGASDNIGSINTLIVSCLGVAFSLVWLVFARELWMLYLFAIVYGFSFGAEIPQQTALIAKYFGLQAGLVGMVHGCGYIGGSIGAWVGGQVFDVTQSYQAAFLIGAAAVSAALVATFLLRKLPPRLASRT